MKWIWDDSYLGRIDENGHAIPGCGKSPLPRWFWLDWWRPKLKMLFWDSAVMFGAGEGLARSGYRLGFILGSHAYVGDELLHHRDAVIYITLRSNWIFFAVDHDGVVIPKRSLPGSDADVFWFDPKPIDVIRAAYLDSREVVDC